MVDVYVAKTSERLCFVFTYFFLFIFFSCYMYVYLNERERQNKNRLVKTTLSYWRCVQYMHGICAIHFQCLSLFIPFSSFFYLDLIRFFFVFRFFMKHCARKTICIESNYNENMFFMHSWVFPDKINAYIYYPRIFLLLLSATKNTYRERKSI